MFIIKFTLIGVTLLLCWLQSASAEPLSPSGGICPNAPKVHIRKCPEYEEFQCCGACEQLSCDKRVGNEICFICPSDCYCKEGYIRERSIDKGNHARCIPIEKCPNKPRGVSHMKFN